MDARRCTDLAVTVVIFPVVSPLLVITALLIKLDSPGPVFFRQTRVGRGGRPFRMVKFRTMRLDAERRGPLITVGADPRITRLGRILRKTKIDELPQLFNVLNGEMSLVGPRPEVERYTTLYTPDQRRVLEARPGITDPASVRYRNESEVLAGAEDPERAYVERIMGEKIRISLDYQKERTLRSDLGVVLKTIRSLFLPPR